MGKQFTLKKPTMLDKDGNAVPAGDPTGIRWLGLTGSQIPFEQAETLGLVKKPTVRKDKADK